MPNLLFYTHLSRMSSVRIAKITNKRHDNVLRDIESMLFVLNLSQVFFQSSYQGRVGDQGAMGTFKAYELSIELTYCLITGYSVTERAAVVREWIATEERLITKMSLPNATHLMHSLGHPCIVSTHDGLPLRATINLQDVLLSTTSYARPMSSLDISNELIQVLGDDGSKRHDNVLRDIDKQFKVLNEDPTPFQGTASYQPYPNSAPRERRVYNLPRDHVLILITGYLPRERYAVITRFFELEYKDDPNIVNIIEDRIVAAGGIVELAF